MKHREVVIFSGQQFLVPQGIQRIDTRSTHGWQVRYQGTKFFSDGSQDGSGASASLDKATKHLLQRIAKHPAPVTIQSAPSVHKSSGLPSGISGPIVRGRAGSVMRVAEFSIVLPRYGESPKRRTVYIGNENTYTVEKYNAALARAMELRAEAEEQYRSDATRARRQAARGLANGTLAPVLKPPRKTAAKQALTSSTPVRRRSQRADPSLADLVLPASAKASAKKSVRRPASPPASPAAAESSRKASVKAPSQAPVRSTAAAAPKASGKASAKAAAKAATKAAAKGAVKTPAKPITPAVKPPAQSAAKAPTRPAAKPTAKPAAKKASRKA